MACQFKKKYFAPRSDKHLELFGISHSWSQLSKTGRWFFDTQQLAEWRGNVEAYPEISEANLPVKPRTLSRIKAAENSLEANIVCASSEGDRPRYKFQDARSQRGRWSHRLLYIGRYPSFEQGPHAFVIACKCRTCSLRNCIVWETYNVVSILLKCTEAILYISWHSTSAGMESLNKWESHGTLKQLKKYPTITNPQRCIVNEK